MIEIKLYKNAIRVEGHARQDVCGEFSVMTQMFGKFVVNLDTTNWWDTKNGRTIVFFYEGNLIVDNMYKWLIDFMLGWEKVELIEKNDLGHVKISRIEETIKNDKAEEWWNENI